jgi:outer membrane protein TolC
VDDQTERRRNARGTAAGEGEVPTPAARARTAVRPARRPARVAWRAARRLTLASALLTGCSPFDGWRLWPGHRDRGGPAPVADDVPVTERVSYAPPVNAVASSDPEPDAAAPPLTVRDLETVEYRDITLDEAIRYALDNSKVMRSLGATVLRNPDVVRSRYQTATQYTDPRFGPEAALAAFDAELLASAVFQKNDRPINNRFFGGGTTQFQQDLDIYRTELRKRAATGTVYSLRNNTQYDANNAPANIFPSYWDTNVEAEVRQPLLQGAGLAFNRIAGPDAVPGVYNGVVVARVNNEISQADFEISLRDFISDVSNAYWELYFAYRDLDARKRARDEAYAVWQRYQARFDADGQRGAGTATDRVALAREQYFRFQREVEEALSGRPGPSTQTEPGGGALRGNGGVLVAERRLRLLMGWPINDRRLLRPSTDPTQVEVLYDWSSVVGEAMARRTELRRQRLLVKRRSLELEASRNFLSPRLDAVGLYRFRGFGHDLLGYDDPRFGNAVGNLVDGSFQEWQLGLEFSAPLGRRRGHAAVQNAELQAARERSLLHEQERQVVHDLSNAVAEKDRAYQAVVTNLERLKAASVLLESLRVLDRESAGADAVSINLDRLLDAQRRVAESESEFYRSLAAYEVALKNVSFEKGSLFDYHEILVTGGEESRAAVTAERTRPAPVPPAPTPNAAPAPEPSPANGPPDDAYEGPPSTAGGSPLFLDGVRFADDGDDPVKAANVVFADPAASPFAAAGEQQAGEPGGSPPDATPVRPRSSY